MLQYKDLRNCQKFMLDYADKKPFCFLGVDMGMGKTVVSLTLAKILLRRKEVNKILIVAPKRVAQHTWPDEIKNWEHLQNLSFSVILGEDSELNRKTAALNPAKIHITNRENLPWLWDFFKKGKNFPYDMLIYDEASRLKGFNFRTKSGKISEFGVLAKARKNNFKRVLLLSGTPAPNGLVDLGGPFYLLDEGERLGTNKTSFRNRYFVVDQYSRAIAPKSFAYKEIIDKISDLMVTLKTEDYVELPEAVEIIKPVNMPTEVHKKYKKLEAEFVLEEHDIIADSKADLNRKLLQLCNGSVYQKTEDELSRDTIEIHELKIEALKTIIEEANDKPVLVAYSYQFDLEKILKAIPEAVAFDSDPTIKDRWNRGEIKVLVAHPASTGHGLNIQKGSNICVWYGLTWSLELFQQMYKRLVRPGQPEDKVFMYFLICPGTYEEKILEVLRSKEATQEDIFNSLSQCKKSLEAKYGTR